jgi:H+/Cl- antiporter ClcA
MMGRSGTKLRDYSADSRMLYMSGLAVIVGAVGAVLSWALLRLIYLCTNLFYFHRWNAHIVDPGANTLGWKAIFLPVIGGLLVGLIARYGSDRIRGHGMPEAIEAILMRGAKISPKITFLKPTATAIAIGSGGPFGAEGPIIMTGGAAGSLIAQLLKMSDAERTVLLVAGAAAGMSATFLAPLSAILLAVELLLFEWRPRSLVPVAVASVVAAAVRRLLLGANPIFPMPSDTGPVSHSVMLGAVVAGVAAALMALTLTKGVHFFEEMFEKLPIHWMWWPAIGGLGIGLGGWIFPSALGVGYPVIQRLLNGEMGWGLIAGVVVIKSLIWMESLGSGTSGGILAPQLMIGGGVGAALAYILPAVQPGGWPLICMAAVLAGSIGVPLTAVVLAVELTHNSSLMLPLLLASVTSYGISVLVQKRSILTERLSRRGYHLSREYGVDPLETVMVAQAMHTSVFALPEMATRRDAAEWLKKMNERVALSKDGGAGAWSHWQRLFPVLSEDGKLLAILTRTQMMASANAADLDAPLVEDGNRSPVTVQPDETLRQVATLMADNKLSHYPVIDEDGKFAGIITIEDLLKGRTREALRETNRDRVLRMRWPFGGKASEVAMETAAEVASLDEEE